jgi:enolase-phosphatase E1
VLWADVRRAPLTRVSASERTTRAFLLDVEGTTTPIAFVTQTLFPYARAHLAAMLAAEGREEDIAKYLALIDEDSKAPELKALQGRIWQQGYRDGSLIGQVFDDVPRALGRWHAAGMPVGIFSSGSVLAQQWLFRRSSAGDLTPFLRWYFDTAVGGKRDLASYARIAATIALAPGHITFVSDVVGELDAARAAGMETILTERPGNAPQPPHDHRVIRSLDELAASPG